MRVSDIMPFMVNSDIDDKMRLFYERTELHIQYVKEFSIFIVNHFPQLHLLLEQVKFHDDSKFQNDELDAYVNATWAFKKGRNPSKDFDVAWEHHRTVNRHHPEYFKNCNDMTDVDIAEMCADCMAMSRELNDDPIEYIKNNHFNEFDFSTEKKTLILDIVTTIWKKYGSI